LGTVKAAGLGNNAVSLDHVAIADNPCSQGDSENGGFGQPPG